MATTFYSMTIDNFSKDNNTFEYLEEVLKEYQLKENIKVHQKVYETSRRGTCHIHMNVEMRPNVYKRRLTKKGISTRIDHLQTIGDVIRWVNYIYKSIPPYERCTEFLEQHNDILRINQNNVNK